MAYHFFGTAIFVDFDRMILQNMAALCVWVQYPSCLPVVTSFIPLLIVARAPRVPACACDLEVERRT